MIKNFQEIISQIKSQIPINELISEFTSVKRSGRGYVCICPFHDDHHPSLQINPQKGIFKCFACGTGGDLITFYALINKKKWAEAVGELAVKYGIKIEYSNDRDIKNETQIKNQLIELNKEALDFYKKSLYKDEGSIAYKYLTQKRKLSDDTINKFELGYAQNSWESLYNHLNKEKKYLQELIIASGLFIVRESGQGYYDRFRNRIIFPIYNENNQIVGFGGRALTEDDVKYINSPETLIFNKGQLLYGLNHAINEIKKLDYAILTEGYMDVITAHQHNLSNTVATLGTAMTQHQARLLTKHTQSKKICLCLDSDAAGKKALEGIFKQIQDISQFIKLDVRVTTDLLSKDLDESLNQEGINIVRNKIENGKKLTHYILDEISYKYLEAASTNNDLKKNELIDRSLEIFTEIQDPIEKSECIKYLSHKININEELINQTIKNKSKQRPVKLQQKRNENTTADEFKMYTLERFRHAELELLSLYIYSFPYCNEIKEKLTDIEFIDDKSKLIKDFLDNLSEKELTSQTVINKLIFEFNEYKHIMSLITDIALKIDTGNTNDTALYQKHKEKIIDEAKIWLKWWQTNKKEIAALTNKFKDTKNKEEEIEILSKLTSLVRSEKNRKKV